MVSVEALKKFKVLNEKLKKAGLDEKISKDITSVVVFNGNSGYFEVNGDFYYVSDTTVEKVNLEEEPDVYCQYDGDGFLVKEDGNVVGFTMPKEEVVITDFSWSSFNLKLTFRYEFDSGKPVIRFAGWPHLVGRLVFYNDLTGWKLGRVEDITPIEGSDYIITGVPVVNGEPKVAPFVPVSFFGYPEDEVIIISLLKNDVERLVKEYSTKDNLRSLAETEGYSIVTFERLLTYRDELLLWEIAEDIVGGRTIIARDILSH